MSYLPVNENEIAAFEERLNVRLPDQYKIRLSDERVRKALSHSTVGVLHPSSTMAEFASFTEEIRKRYPEFPRGGVIISCSFNLDFGYDRFLVPDKNDPKTLGTIVYTWDKEKRRKIRDCSLEEWINMPIGCAPPGLLAELGLEAKRTEEKPAFRIKPCSEPIKSLLKSGDVESQEIGAGANSWIPYATITIKGRYLVPCDLGQVPQLKGSPAIEVSPGAYRVDVKVVQSRLGRWGAVAAVRIISPESTEYDTNKKFDVAVDLAAIAIYDRQAFFKRIPLEERDFFCSDLIDVQEKLFIAITGKTEILIIPSGDGDGSYPVYQLESNGNKVGMEIRFMGEDH